MKATDVTSVQDELPPKESPEYVRTSLAAAMTMGKLRGKFYRNVKLYCINLLLTYDEGCHAKCAYCGLSGSRKTETEWTDNSFIRVDWPVIGLQQVKEALTNGTCPHVERVCVSMITRGEARNDCIEVVSQLREIIPRISVLMTPTIVNTGWLEDVKAAGADMIGIAIDAATPEIFQEYRGVGVKGPHRWQKYWKTVEQAIEIFGTDNVGIHFIVGLGETEREMVSVIQKAQDIGAKTHLFSFFPENGSDMEDHPQPPIGAYRRIQLARYLINKEIALRSQMSFNGDGQIIDFEIDSEELECVIKTGKPFMTSGCRGETRDNACNRPFGNCTPFQASIGHWRNFPMRPNEDDLSDIRKQLDDYSLSYEMDDVY